MASITGDVTTVRYRPGSSRHRRDRQQRPRRQRSRTSPAPARPSRAPRGRCTTTSFSTQPPETDPSISPSEEISIREPGPLGADPYALTDGRLGHLLPLVDPALPLLQRVSHGLRDTGARQGAQGGTEKRSQGADTMCVQWRRDDSSLMGSPSGGDCGLHGCRNDVVDREHASSRTPGNGCQIGRGSHTNCRSNRAG